MNYTDIIGLIPLIAGFQIQVPPQAATQITSARKWLFKAENLYGAESPMTVPFLYELAYRTVRYGNNNFRTALPLLQRAYDIQEKQGFPEGPDMATAMARLGECLIFTGDHAKAEELLKQALVIREKTFGAEDPLTGYVYASLVMLFIAKSNPGADPFMLMMQLSISPLRTDSLNGELKELAEKALTSYDLLQSRKYDSTIFKPRREFNYSAMSVAFRLEEDMNSDFTERLKELNGISGGGGGQAQGCFVATAVYGSYNCPEVVILRKFRNDVLLQNIPGRVFVALYYKAGPALAVCVRKIPFAGFISKAVIDRIVKIIYLRSQK